MFRKCWGCVVVLVHLLAGIGAAQSASSVLSTQVPWTAEDVGVGNTLDLEFDTSVIGGGVPSGWGATCIAVTVGASTGAAFTYENLPPSTRGYITDVDFLLASTSMADGSVITVAAAKAATSIYGGDQNWRLDLIRVGANYRFQLLIDEGGDLVTWTSHAGTTIAVGELITHRIIYDILHQQISWSIDGTVVNSTTMISENPQVISSRLVGSSGASDGRNTVYLLDRVAWTEIQTGVVRRVPPTAVAAPPNPATIAVQRPSWSMYANPADDASIVTAATYRGNTAGKIVALTKATTAGVDHHQEVLKWSEVEATVGNYTWTRIDTLVDNTTQPIVLNIAPIWDDGTKTVPASLAAVAWDHADMADAYTDMLTALAAHVDQRLWILSVGNEADIYLGANLSQVTPFAAFLGTVRTHARTVFGTNPFSVTVTFRSTAAATAMSTYSAIMNATDIESFTYYPTASASAATLAATIEADIIGLAETIGSGTPFLLQEIGLTSEGVSSTTLQNIAAIATQTLLTQLSATFHAFVGATWSQLNDISPTVLASFGYTSGDLTAGNGLYTTAGVPKDAFTALCQNFGGANCQAPPPPACTFAITPANAAHSAGAVISTNLTLTTQAGCAWTLSVIDGTPAYFSIAPTSGTGSDTLAYTVTANTDTVGRSLTAVVGDTTWGLTQEGLVTPPPPPPACTYTLNDLAHTFLAAADDNTANLTTNSQDCQWLVSELDGAPDWLSITPASGTGNGTLTYVVTANVGEGNRVGRFMVAAPSTTSQTIFVVTQEGVDPPDDPPPPALVCTSTTNSPTGRNPKIFWDPCQQDAYNRMYACYLVNTAAPPSGMQGALDCGNGEGGRWMKRNIDLCTQNALQNGMGVYVGMGRQCAIQYQTTGNTAVGRNAFIYFRKFWTKNDGMTVFGTIDQPTHQFSRNDTREWMIEMAMMYDWLYPVLTTEERTDFATWLNHTVDLVLSKVASTGVYQYITALDDSDELTGHYFGIALIDIALGQNRLAETFDPPGTIDGVIPVGGFAATAGNRATLRNRVREMIETFADGGAWMESCVGYNAGTMQLLIMGYRGILTGTGVDYFPELTTRLGDLAKVFVHEFGPDLIKPFRCGDVENPGPDAGMHILERMNFGLIMAGLNQAYSPYLHKYVFDQITATNTSLPGQNRHVRAMYGWDPYAPQSTTAGWKTHFGTAQLANGQGFWYARNGWAATDAALFHVAPTTAWVHHQGQITPDVMFVWNGKWMINRPHCYGCSNTLANQDTSNMVLANNMGRSHEGGGIGATEHVVAEYSYSYGNNVGMSPNDFASSSRQNATQILENGRSVMWFPATDSQTLVVFDRANIKRSQDDPRYGIEFSYPAATRTLIEAAPTKQWTLHTETSPVRVGKVLTWTPAVGYVGRSEWLLPEAEPTYFTEAYTKCLASGCGFNRKFVTKISPAGAHQQWDTFLNCLTFYTGANPVACTGLSSSAGQAAQGALVVRTGLDNKVVMFSAKQGATEITSTFVAGRASFIDGATKFDIVRLDRLLTTGYTFLYTQTTTAAKLYIADLNHLANWTININGAGAVALEPSDQGLATLTVNGTGAKSVVIIGDGTEPEQPPDPEECATITNTPTSLTAGLVGSAYSQAITASGGTGPYTYTLFTGAFPTNLTLSSGGLLSGTLAGAVPGVYTFAIRATDAGACTGNTSYTLTITAPEVVGIARLGTPANVYNATGSVNSVSKSVTIGTASDRIAIAELVLGSSDTSTGCTYNSVAFTLIAKLRVPGDRWYYAYQLVNPATGANTFTCTSSANIAMFAGIHGYQNVDQVTPINGSAVFCSAVPNTSCTAATAVPGSIASGTLDVTRADTWTVMGTRSPVSSTAGSGSFSNYSFAGYIGSHVFDSLGAHASAGIKTMQATYGSATTWGAIVFALNAAE